jgi:hypothetical protein
LKFQWGTRAPYLLFAFSKEGAQLVNIKVHLKEEELSELAYFIAEDDEKGVSSDKFDDSMSIIAFCVKPSQANKLDKFSDWYDGATSGKKYITIEVRDKEEFQVSCNRIVFCFQCTTLTFQYHPLPTFFRPC